ncbi:MAG: hypothetical protein J6S92_10255 [Oscillospiraceae bacterium]|nr:hypothetical protein [Oscillospiraceae bacterium]
MAEDFVTHFTNLTASFSEGEDHLSAEERRLMSLRNFAMSKASKARKKRKKQRTEPQSGKMTDAERRSREQERIREERETRSARSEENRRLAGIGGGEAPAPNPDPKRGKQKAPEKESRKAAPDPAEAEIDIEIPTEKKPERTKQPVVKSKKTKRTKQQSETQTRATSAARYSKSGAPERPNRITTGGAVTLGILTGVLIGTVIYGRVQTNEIYTEIAELQTEYDDLTARNISMKSEMEGKMTVKKIEEYAEDVLGLRPLNQSQIEYIQLQTEDEVTVSEPESNFFVTVNDYLVSIWEFLRGK